MPWNVSLKIFLGLLKVLSNKFITLIILSTLIFLILITSQLCSTLLGPVKEWNWNSAYEWVTTPLSINLYAIILLILIACIIILYARNKTRFSIRDLLLISILGFLFLVAVMLLGINSGCIITPVSAEMRDYILDSNMITDVNNFLANYNSLLSTFRGHSTTKPPGTLLFFYFMNKIANIVNII